MFSPLFGCLPHYFHLCLCLSYSGLFWHLRFCPIPALLSVFNCVLYVGLGTARLLSMCGGSPTSSTLFLWEKSTTCSVTITFRFPLLLRFLASKQLYTWDVYYKNEDVTGVKSTSFILSLISTYQLFHLSDFFQRQTAFISHNLWLVYSSFNKNSKFSLFHFLLLITIKVLFFIINNNQLDLL